MNEADLRNMSDEDLIDFADRVLGLVVPFGTKRTTIMTRIINAAVVIRDGR